MSLINDTFICPFVIHINEKFSYGSFLKFHMAETVTEFYSQERLFEAPVGTTAVSNQHYFRFVFDYEYHRFGIEENGGKLPSPEVMKKTLAHFLERIAIDNFPSHHLTINLISDSESLNAVFAKGNEFGNVEVKIVFPNSHRLTKTLRELRDCSAHSLAAQIAPARGSRMSALPSYITDLVKSAPEFGEAKVTFFKRVSNSVGKFKKFVYSTYDFPKRVSLRQKKNEDETTFINRVWANIKAKAEIDQP
jgi:hypothetical protein